jgi:hypothetical protein
MVKGIPIRILRQIGGIYRLLMPAGEVTSGREDASILEAALLILYPMD